MTPDIEYFTSGLFTRFVANTPAGEDAWREMAKDDGCAAVLSHHDKAVIAQLRAAGYSVAKAKPVVAISDDELLSLLNA